MKPHRALAVFGSAPLAITLGTLLLCLSGGWTMAAPTTEYLGELLQDRLVFFTQGWGELGIDVSAHARDKTPLPLQIGDKRYTRGLGHHANGELDLALDGEYALFESEVGVLWQGGNVGSIVFQVFVDGKLRFDSGVMRERDPARPVKIDVTGAQLLRLVATDGGDDITCDCACWAQARLTRDPAAKAVAATRLDIAPFGRVVTFDPHRADGAHASRVQEFPEGDVYLADDLPPRADGAYVVPLLGDGTGCLGLQWVERRLLRTIGLVPAAGAALPAGTRAQVWIGESWWQGTWEDLAAAPEQQDGVWRWPVKGQGKLQLQARGIQKVRWVFPQASGPVVIQRAVAYTRSVWDTLTLRLESDATGARRRASIAAYNGEFIDPAAGQARRREWDMQRPLTVSVRYSQPTQVKADRTVLRFSVTGPGEGSPAAFGVAVEDILAHGYVWVPSAGVYVTRDPGGPPLDETRRKIAAHRTVLDRVRALPDQTFEQAWAKVHDPAQDLGPMLLSLACDNRKFQVQRDGTVQFSTQPDVAARGSVSYPVELRVRCAAAAGARLSRHLEGEWLPIPVTTLAAGDVTYRQRTHVAPYGPDARPLGVVEFSAENRGAAAVQAAWTLTISADAAHQTAANLVTLAGGLAACREGRVLAYVNTTGLQTGTLEAVVGHVELTQRVAPGATVQFVACLPTWELTPDGCGELPGYGALLPATQAYWERQLADAMAVELPSPLLANAIKASQVHCLLAARNEAAGERIAAWISSDRYGPLESEAHSPILGMDLFGHHEFARRALDFFIHRYNPAGYLTTGYTLMGTGWHLWTLARHVELTADAAWLRRVAPEVTRACEWIVRQRAKTGRTAPDGPDAAQWGLMPPGVVADWGLYCNRYYMDANYCAGLREAARVLAAIDSPAATGLAREAAAYQDALRHSYAWTQARAPVRPRQDGTWYPAAVGMASCYGTVGEFFGSEDGARSWATDAEIGPHQLVALGVIPPDAPDAAWTMDELEDRWCLESGMGAYPAANSRSDWFSLGGFPKIQPYYGRMPQVYALRDEVKPFIRAYFNAIPSLLSAEVLSFWEHFHNRGGWNKTHETGGFLHQTRTMLAMERGEELWLAPFVTNHWLQDGMAVSVRNAPTQFGTVSYRIRSHAARGRLQARIQVPDRTPPRAVVIRLRHPEGKPMQAVTVNGKPHTDFDAARECVRLVGAAGECTVEANY